MATRKAASLEADLIARKGEAAPAQPPTSTSPSAASVPHGTKDTIALTVRLDEERYRRLVAYAAAIPAEPSDPVITVSAALAFRKHRCENTP